MGDIKTQQLYDTEKISDQILFTEELYHEFMKNEPSHIIILCIGTDRATGDSLGPLIGHKLQNLDYPMVHVLGTLENPVHAKNLEKTIGSIQEEFENPLIIAIDACLGKLEHIGLVGFGRGTIKPGAGVNKTLPEVGDYFITGIVNFSGVMDMVILQNTRLHLVMKMADYITFALKSALWKYNREMTPPLQKDA